MYANARIRLEIVAVGIMVIVCGCQRDTPDQAEHHTPAHKPLDYPAAVVRLLELHVEIFNERQRDADQMDVFAETYDVVRWLPELAADSDLEEEPWNRAVRASRHWEAILSAVMKLDHTERASAYRSHDRQLDDVQRELIDIQSLFPSPQVESTSTQP